MSTTSSEKSSSNATPEAVKTASSGAQIVANIAPTKEAETGNVAIATNSGVGTSPKLGKLATAEQLREAAVVEAARVDAVSDEEGWGLMELMLRVRESFVNPATGKLAGKPYEAFLEKHGAKPHGNVKHPLRRLAQVCCPKTTDSDRVSKYGYALTALTKRDIGSATVRAELQKREAIKPGGPLRWGINRFVLLHRQVVQKNTPQKSEKSPNRYMAYEPDRLRKEAVLILLALKDKGLIPPQFEGIEAALSEPAQAA